MIEKETINNHASSHFQSPLNGKIKMPIKKATYSGIMAISHVGNGLSIFSGAGGVDFSFIASPPSLISLFLFYSHHFCILIFGYLYPLLNIDLGEDQNAANEENDQRDNRQAAVASYLVNDTE